MLNFFRKSKPIGKVEWLIVCLGNPGAKYHNTRHNAGFLEADYIAQKCGTEIKKLKFKSMCGDALISGKRVLIIKPQTFMNISGEAVSETASFYKIPTEKILVISDDSALPLGRIRIRKKGSDGGHNGLKSIILQLSSDDFPRIRIGVGDKPHPNYDLADWVLGRFTSEEQKIIFQSLENAYSALELIVAGKTEEAMNEYNS